MTAAARSGRRTQEARRTEAEERLLRAAAELISESGPAGVTLAKVGERAGYSRGLAAHHFGSKAALMQRVADAVASDFADALRVEDLPEADPIDGVLALVRVYFDVIAQPPVLNRARLVLIADAVAHTDAEARPVIVEASREFRRRLSRQITSAVEAGGLPEDTDADALALTLIGTLRGIAFESMLDDAVDLDGARRQVEALIRSGVRRS